MVEKNQQLSFSIFQKKRKKFEKRRMQEIRQLCTIIQNLEARSQLLESRLRSLEARTQETPRGQVGRRQRVSPSVFNNGGQDGVTSGSG